MCLALTAATSAGRSERGGGGRERWYDFMRVHWRCVFLFFLSFFPALAGSTQGRKGSYFRGQQHSCSAAVYFGMEFNISDRRSFSCWVKWNCFESCWTQCMGYYHLHVVSSAFCIYPCAYVHGYPLHIATWHHVLTCHHVYYVHTVTSEYLTYLYVLLWLFTRGYVCSLHVCVCLCRVVCVCARARMLRHFRCFHPQTLNMNISIVNLLWVS
jgi:hypothetical protein